MTYSKIFLYCCLSFLGGIFLNSFLKIPQPTILFFLILVFVLIIFREHKKLFFLGLCILFLFLGIWRHQTAELKIITDRLRKFNDSSQTFTLSGVIMEEPDVKENNTKLAIKVENVNLKAGKGKILITTQRYPEYDYGDRLKIRGKLKTPEKFPDFNYKDYLAKDGIYSVMYYPEIKLIEKDQGNFVFAKILSFKENLREIIYQILLPPQSLILGAMILGDKGRISNIWKEKLSTVGLSHITAVSGMHIVILIGVLMSLLIGLGFWRGQAFYFAIILIALFIILTGCQNSAVRAGIMGSLLLVSQKFGRLSQSSRAVIFAATVMLFINPFLLRYDIGFQLSFLAVMGIIYLGPTLKNWLKFIPEEKHINLKNILVMTLSAQIFTLPILVYNFGKISLISPITNVLILPVIYWIMLLGFIFAIAGIIFQPLGWILSVPVFILLTYLIKVVDFFSKIPFSSKTLKISWIYLLTSYLILGLITWRSQKKLDVSG